MIRTLTATTFLTGALALSGTSVFAGDMAKSADAPKIEKCYGVAGKGKNDCASATGAHSCAGQSTKARDPKEFIDVPAGLCDKIEGGKKTSG